ncbi:MAG: cytochrome c family protein [Opitutales bacterium]
MKLPKLLFPAFLLPIAAFCTPNPAKVEGPESCAECHAVSVEAWKQTSHFNTFNEMHRRPEAREIAEKLGIRRIKFESLCLSCHYTAQETEGGEIEVIAGISCESCHGAAEDWIDIHSNYGEGYTKETEPAEHRQMRIEKSVANGMIHPRNLYAVATNCYECHLVPNERLVNVGGHPAGSKNFELVSWLNGEVRHNFQDSDGKVNEEIPIEDKRMLFLLSIILEVEHGLRGTAIATTADTYGKTLAVRTDTAKKKLAQVTRLLQSEDLAAIYKAANAAKLTLNNEAELVAAAEEVQRLGQAFAQNHDGSQFGQLDQYIESATPKGEVYQPNP